MKKLSIIAFAVFVGLLLGIVASPWWSHRFNFWQSAQEAQLSTEIGFYCSTQPQLLPLGKKDYLYLMLTTGFNGSTLYTVSFVKTDQKCGFIIESGTPLQFDKSGRVITHAKSYPKCENGFVPQTNYIFSKDGNALEITNVNLVAEELTAPSNPPVPPPYMQCPGKVGNFLFKEKTVTVHYVKAQTLAGDVGSECRQIILMN